MRNKPSYALQSVDSALRLAQILQAFGPMRVSDVATELDIAVSTAHRLLAMLVYRGFAEQLPDRRYGPGAGLMTVPVLDPAASELRARARGPMLALVTSVGESATWWCSVESRCDSSPRSNAIVFCGWVTAPVSDYRHT